MIINELINQFSHDDYNMVEFNNQTHSRIQVRPMYFELGFSPSSRIFGRRVVLDRLLKALNSLPLKYGFLIWDVYRPRAVQSQLFDWMREEIRKKSPHLTDQDIYTEARKYMSPPSKVGDEYCPPHLSGGAIDLTLYEIADGKEVEMGTPFDDCTERAHSDYFNLKTQLSPEEEGIKERRHLLRTAMENVGFTSYQYEWWHFDIGDIFWSRIVKQPTVFGPLFGEEEWPIDRTV
jgi:zinc D-Ala-D-Ala dipeptidase